MRVFTNYIAAAALIAAVAVFGGCRAQSFPEDTKLRFNHNASVRMCYADRVDSLINDAISREAMPGCRVLVAQNRRIIFDKCYGYLDYDSIEPVTDSTLYDLASVTKVAASSLAIMAMYDDGVIDLDRPLTKYINGITDNGATLRDALAHQAGFKAWVPLVSKEKDIAEKVAAGLPLDTLEVRRRIIFNLASQKLSERGNYLYSDLGFYVYPEFVRKYYRVDFEKFLNDRFYAPMGIRPVYNPLRFYPMERIAPTENDTVWRKRVVRGTVHDEGAAMMGGVSGHAGLFAQAMDVAVIMQMILNRGVYDGIRYIRAETVDLFTSQAFPENRRGLVFDKPVLDTALNGTPSTLASRQSFGHTGFTGSFVWADPENKLLLVFLCNSSYPCRSKMLSQLNVRTQLHDIFYSADLLID